MSNITLATLAAAEGEGGGHEEVVWQLPIPAIWYGIIALAVFLLLLGITWAVRNTAHTLIYGPDGVPRTSTGRGTRPEPGAAGHGAHHGGGH